MTTHHISLYDHKTYPAPENVFKQELITYQQTEYGLKVTKLERSFRDSEHLDSYTSSPIALDAFSKQES